MYSVYIVFIVPAIQFHFFRTWIAFCIPIVMVTDPHKFIRAEEVYLEGQFGDEYLK